MQTLQQRRELVVLAAQLQRATIARRLDRIEQNPARRVLGFAASAVSRPAMLRVGSALVAYAIRTYRMKRLKRSVSRSGH